MVEKHLVVSQSLRYNIKHVKSYILPLNACIILELALILMIQAIFFSKECETGYFGSECLNKCGHCLNASYCHHINGSCLNGCSKGYKGEDCKECKLYYNYDADVIFFKYTKA